MVAKNSAPAAMNCGRHPPKKVSAIARQPRPPTMPSV
jgi:hypothetical protein